MKDIVKKFLQKCKQYAERSSIHGIPDIKIAESLVVKCFWTICIFGSVAYLATEIRGAIQQYETEPTVSDLKVITHQALPSVLFCPRQWMDGNKLRSKITKGVNLSATVQMIESVFPLSFFFLPAVEYTDITEYQRDMIDTDDANVIKKELDLEGSVSDFMIAIAKELPISCEVALECFAQRIISIYGLCYKLVVVNKKRNLAGLSKLPLRYLDYKVYITLDSKETLNAPVEGEAKPVNKVHDTRGESSDFLLIGDEALIHPATAIQLTSGQKFRFSYQAMLIKRVNTKFYKCNIDNNYLDVANCLMQCINTKLCINVGSKCILLSYNSSGQFGDYCNYLQAANHCLFPMLQNESVTVYSQCEKQCAVPCNQSSYQVTVSINTEHPETDWIFEPLNVEAVLSITEMKLYNWSTLLSNIGGMISLFCGASVLSIVQIISICCLETGVWKWMGEMREPVFHKRNPRDSLASLYHDVGGDFKRPSLAIPRGSFATPVRQLQNPAALGHM